MKCEEFESMGLGAEHDGALGDVQQAAVREHAMNCSHCAALQDSWLAAREDLRLLALETEEANTPPRVEMRLLQNLRLQNHTLHTRRAAVITAWALATAAVFAGVLSLRNWKKSQLEAARHVVTSQTANNAQIKGLSNGKMEASAKWNDGNVPLDGGQQTLLADNDANGFTLLPGSFSTETDDAAIVRVRMQRGTLGAWGLPVNEERANDWVQVDLLVGNDGQPTAVRLPQSQ